MPEGRPEFGKPPEKPRKKKPTSPEGQMNFGLDNLLLTALENSSTSVSLQEEKPISRREQERGWDVLTLNEGTNKPIKMKGRFYTISAEREKPLQIRNSPPETWGSGLLDSIKGYRVFALKDSEKSDDPLTKGWASIIVLEITPKGEKPKIKTYSNGIQDFVLVRAWFNDIKSEK